MDRLDRADVDALRRLLGDDQPRAAGQLASELNLLLVAARKRAGERVLAGAADVEAADQVAGAPAGGADGKQRPARQLA